MKIGVCTGGGDCPGLNAAIRAVVKYAATQNIPVVGILDSINGLFRRPTTVKDLTNDQIQGILTRGGSILGTFNSGNPFKDDHKGELIKLTLEGTKMLGLDVVVVIGGEGSQGISKLLIDAGLNIIGIPKTIDNDLPGTDQTIGFSSCVDIVAEALERLHSTAESHHRVMVLEVMGRDSGYIALHGGIAGGAHVILIPEIPFSYEAICEKILARKKMGRNFSLVVVSEGAFENGADPLYSESSTGVKNLGGIGDRVAKKIYEMTQMDTRYTVLGHLQRGGSPNPTDRILASRFGVHAVELAIQKKYNRLVVFKNGKVDDIPYSNIEQWKRKKIGLNDSTLKTAEFMDISLGR